MNQIVIEKRKSVIPLSTNGSSSAGAGTTGCSNATSIVGAGATSFGSVGSALVLFSAADSSFSVVSIDSGTSGRVSTGAGRIASCDIASSAMINLSRSSSKAKVVDNGTVVHASQWDSIIAISDGLSNARIDGVDNVFDETQLDGGWRRMSYCRN